MNHPPHIRRDASNFAVWRALKLYPGITLTEIAVVTGLSLLTVLRVLKRKRWKARDGRDDNRQAAGAIPVDVLMRDDLPPQIRGREIVPVGDWE